MQLVFQGRPSPLYFFGSISLAVLVCLMGLVAAMVPEMSAGPFFLVAAAVLLRPFVKIFGSHYTMTSHGLVERRGILSRRTSEVEIEDIRNIQVKQGILERAFGLGSILVSTAGQSGIEVVFWGIKKPEEIAKSVQNLRRGLSKGESRAA